MSDAQNLAPQTAAATAPAFDGARFRDVLSHYPTGVAVVTARVGDDDLGMVVGSFTSVSMDPPLVAFMATCTSRTYARLKDARHFVINILAADQEHLCRQFSSRTVQDKWAGVEWLPGRHGIRKLAGAVAHIECTHAATHPGGDHDIVLGSVDVLDVHNPVLPLLFFQGAYGKFVPKSFVVSSHVDVVAALRISDVAAPHLEKLARELGVECVAQAKAKDQLIFIASHQSGTQNGSVPRLGQRIPHVPPLGSLFMAWEPDDVIEGWLRSTSPKLGDDELARLRAAVQRVRGRGYSFALQADDYGPLEQVTERFTYGQATPAEERFLRGIAVHLTDRYEPEQPPLAEDQRIRVVSVPVFNSAGTVGLVLQIWKPPVYGQHGLDEMVSRLQAVASDVENTIGGVRPA